MRNILHVEADIKGQRRVPAYTVTQNDSVRLIVTVLDGGEPIRLDEVTTITLACTRRDGQVVVKAGEQTGPNEITFDLGTTEIEIVGKVDAVIQLYTSDDRVSTIKFSFTVTKDPTGEGYVPSEDELTLIEVVLGDGPLVLQRAEEAATSAESAVSYIDGKKPLIDKFTGEQTSLQAQVDQLVVDGDSSPEAAQARVDAKDIPHSTLKARLDAEYREVTAQLADIAYNVKVHFGAKGDYNPITGIGSDDTVALRSALKSGNKLYLPGNYKITSPISQIFTKDIEITGNGGAIYYVPTAHSEYAIKLIGAGINFDISDINFFGNKICNKALEIENNTTETQNESVVSITNSNIGKVKRNKSFAGGSGLFVRGNFRTVTLDNVNIADCELPEGQGTSGSVGISGVTFTEFNANSFVKKSIVRNSRIEKIYSSDITYKDDQDGITHLSSPNAESTCIIQNVSFVNCYGRSIKTQTKNTIVDKSEFTRNEGFDFGNNEIDVQYGGLSANDLTFNYRNGKTPTSCIMTGSNISLNVRPTSKIFDVRVFLDDTTKLKTFYSTYPRSGKLGRSDLNLIKIHGSLAVLADYSINGDDNIISLKSCYAEKFEDVDGLAKSFVAVKASGSISPFTAKVIVEDCINANATISVPLMRDRISGAAATGMLYPKHNFGFSDSEREVISSITSAPISGSKFDIKNGSLSANAEVEIDISSSYGAMAFLTFGYNQNAYANFYVYGTNTITVINKGQWVEFGNLTEPIAGVFRVWTSASGKLKIKNADAATRTYSIFIMATR